VLVLPYVLGGDLLTLVNDDAAHASLTESTLRQIARELLGAVAWMHGVGIVHRDIKLEST
jgi:protein-serine/threonine kinase